MSDSNPPGDREALDRLLGGTEMAWLVKRVRSRISGRGGDPLEGIVVNRSPTISERGAAAKLVGRPKRLGTTLRLELSDVEAILRRGPWPAGLADAVVTLTGPVIDQRATQVREEAAWAAAGDRIAAAPVTVAGFGPWWEAWCAAGGLKRLARSEAARLGRPYGPEVARRLVDQLVRVLDALPSADTPIAVFARQVIGDAHGLDVSRPLGRLAAAVVGAAFGPVEARGGSGENKLSRRDAWAASGVVLSNVSSTVLALGLSGAHGDLSTLGAATATAVEAMRRAQAPVVLTLDQVRSDGIAPLAGHRTVHVCENPTVVEVVARHWTEAPEVEPVLVCTEGQPTTAVTELLGVLTSDGATCRYHGDFDWHGLRIAQAIRTKIAWLPWRYGCIDYREAVRDVVRSAVYVDQPPLRLIGSPAQAPWDPDLVLAMAEEGLAVEEEAVVESLAADVMAC